MNTKKTEFRFVVNADPTAINMVINRFLTANQFAPVAKPGANYFHFNDPILKGKRSLEYYINGNEVIILAYIGTFEKPKPLEGFVGALPKQSYRNDLEILFQELQKLNMQGAMPQQMNMQGVMPQQNNSADVFVEQNNKKRETWTIVGFILSLIGLLLSCVGVSYGVLILILEFYCGVQGLKTKKRGLAIATIVIACVSLVIIALEVALSVLLA